MECGCLFPESTVKHMRPQGYGLVTNGWVQTGLCVSGTEQGDVIKQRKMKKSFLHGSRLKKKETRSFG